METETSYAFGECFVASFNEVEQLVREELAKEGFGVLTEINVKNKFAEKLGRDFRDYIILGACNPALAWEAFAMELNIGTLLPCNVVVYRNDEEQIVVMVMDPLTTIGVIGNEKLTSLAGQVKAKMERVLAALRQRLPCET